MKLCIIGNTGNFGSFLQKELDMVEFHPEESADTFILAIPFREYNLASKKLISTHGNKIHFVNVCSVQEETTGLLLQRVDNYQGAITSIHPLFGPRSSRIAADRVSILTYASGIMSNPIVELFGKISTVRRGLTSEQHDKYMARTHYQVVKIADQITKIVTEAEDIPEYMLTPSFKKMKELSNQFLDMPQGTRESILSNKYGSENIHQ